MERNEGLIDRTWVAGVNVVEIIIAQVVTQFCILLVQMVVLVTVLIFGFKVHLTLLLTLYLSMANGAGVHSVSAQYLGGWCTVCFPRANRYIRTKDNSSSRINKTLMSILLQVWLLGCSYLLCVVQRTQPSK